MATKVTLKDAVELNLPGRRSREILSGAQSADCALRFVEIAVPQAGDTARPPHWHPDCSECIHVLSGQGITWVEGASFAMEPGDTIHIAANEQHVTRNTGTVVLTLLCYFPCPEITVLTETAGPNNA